jgi:hypothetical protein
VSSLTYPAGYLAYTILTNATKRPLVLKASNPMADPNPEPVIVLIRDVVGGSTA